MKSSIQEWLESSDWHAKPSPREPVKRARLVRPHGGVETLERLLRWPGLLKKITLPCYIYSRRRKCFLHTDGVRWEREKIRPAYPQWPVPGVVCGNWEPEVALKMARKLGIMDEIELHELF